jgi:hypothetical protein
MTAVPIQAGDFASRCLLHLMDDSFIFRACSIHQKYGVPRYVYNPAACQFNLHIIISMIQRYEGTDPGGARRELNLHGDISSFSAT